MARPTSELTPEFRRRFRKAARKSAEAEAELRAIVREGRAAEPPESLSAMARELGVEVKTLWARVQAWDAPVRNPDQRNVKRAK